MTKIFFVLAIIMLSSCDKNNNNNTNMGVCDKLLFEKVDEREYIRISITLKMSYVPEDEDELIKEVAEIQDEFIKTLKDLDLNVAGIQKLKRRPRIAMSVDKKALIFICNHKEAEDVREEIPDSTQ